MHGARDELLAGPAVAGDEQRRVRRRRGLQLAHDLEHPRRGPDEPPEHSAHSQLPAQQLDFPGRLAALEGAVQQELQARRIHRLRQIVVRAVLDRLHRALDAALTGQDQHRRRREFTLEADEELHAVDPRHHEVGDHEVGSALRGALQRLAAVAGGDHVVAPGRQQLLKPPARAGLVLDHQEAPVPRQILLRRPLGSGRSTLGGLGRSARTRAWLPPRVGRGRGGRNPDLARRVLAHEVAACRPTPAIETRPRPGAHSNRAVRSTM